MHKHLIIKKNKFEKLIEVAIVLSPFTSIRLFGIGISEIIFLMLLLYSFFILGNTSIPKNSILFNMYFIIIFSSIIGWVYNFIFLGNVGDQSSGLFNLIAYFICMLCCLSVEKMNKMRLINVERVICETFILFSMILFILFVLSRFTDNIFGLYLIYYNHFCPLSDNIHQTAMILSMFPFLGAYVLFNSDKFTAKITTLFFIIVDIYIGINTGSSKFKLGLVLGILVFMAFFISEFGGKYKMVFIGILVCGAIMFVLINSQIFVNIFVENDTQGARKALYTNGIITVFESPLFGYGPMMVVKDNVGNYRDVHETVLNAFTSGGILGGLALILTIFSLYKKLFNNKYLIAASCGFLIYLLGGDVLRKECMWILVYLFASTSMKYKTIEL